MASASDKPEVVYGGRTRKEYMEELELRVKLGLIDPAKVKYLVPRTPDFMLLQEIYINKLNEKYMTNAATRAEFESLVVKLGSSDVWVMSEKLASIAMERKIRDELEGKAIELATGGSIDAGLAAARTAQAQVAPFAGRPPVQ